MEVSQKHRIDAGVDFSIWGTREGPNTGQESEVEGNLEAEDRMRSFAQHRFFLLRHLLTSDLISRMRPRGCSWAKKALIQTQRISSASAGTSTGLAQLVGFHAVRYLLFRPTVYSAVPTPCLPLFSRTSQTLFILSWDAPPSCHFGLISEKMSGERKKQPQPFGNCHLYSKLVIYNYWLCNGINAI